MYRETNPSVDEVDALYPEDPAAWVKEEEVLRSLPPSEREERRAFRAMWARRRRFELACGAHPEHLSAEHLRELWDDSE
jgi:hypothetical protein